MIHGFITASLAIGQPTPPLGSAQRPVDSPSQLFQAIAGKPFGVGSLSIPIGTVEPGRLPRVVVSDSEGRIFYPTVDLEPVQYLEDGTIAGSTSPGPPRPEREVGRGGLVDRLRNVIRQSQEIVDPPRVLRIQFLFVGETPLQIHLAGDYTLDTVVVPESGGGLTTTEPMALATGNDSTSIGPNAPSNVFKEPAASAHDSGRRTVSSGLHRALLERWWDGYANEARRQLEASDYPPGIETYLCEMLASRLDLPPRELRSKREIVKAQRDVPLSTLELLGGVESLRDDVMRASLSPRQLAGDGASDVRKSFGIEKGINAGGNPWLAPSAQGLGATVPLPPAPLWTNPVVPMMSEKVPIESIASHVPPECFYIRFERFANYLWFQQLTEAQGRGISQMIMLRGIDYQSDKRVERMLNTKTTALAKLFGDAVIQDIALIGLDLYMQDGPAMGVLFESSSPDLLMQSLDSERTTTAAQQGEQGVLLEDIELLGSKVTFLSSPDNRIRSFRARAGNYILITTSKTLCKRFLEVDQGSPSLASSPSFQYARLSMPLQNEYSLFAFFSPQFFRSLVSPQYTIELRRRFRAIAHLQLAEMATLVDKHESTAGVETSSDTAIPRNEPAKSNSLDLPTLIAKKLLPPWFIDATPESQPIYQMTQATQPNGVNEKTRGQKPAGHWIDSLRGARGSFIPIPDIDFVECAPEEAASYVEQSSYYATHWQQTDPLAVGIRRFAHPTSGTMERLAIEAYVAPFGRDKYGWLSQVLAPPVRTRIQLPADDVVNLQIHMSGQSLLGFAPVQDHVLFSGVKDLIPPPPNANLKLIETLRTLQMTPAYVGAWPRPGYLDRLPFGLGGGLADPYGFSRMLIGAWRWQGNGFSVLSFDRSILENSIRTLQVVPAIDPAQARATIADLENSKLSTWINTYWYRRGLQGSRGNARLLDTIQTQFQIPAIESKDVAERLIDGVVQCPLGGVYAMTSTGRNDVGRNDVGKKEGANSNAANALWSSSAWPVNPSSINTQPNQPLAQPSRPYAAGIEMNPETAFPPAEYRAPWLGWFRGGQIHVTQLSNQLILVGQVDLEKLSPVALSKSDAEPKKALPKMNFDLFSVPFNIFGGGKQNDAPEKNLEKKPDAPKTREF